MKLDSNRVAIVTGASRGIGRAIAVALARKGVRIAALARSLPALGPVAQEVGRLGVACVPLACDVRSRDEVARAVEHAVAHFGRIDVVVNNAGSGSYAPFFDADLDDFHELMQVNYFGALYMTRSALPCMLRQGSGHVVFVASLAGRIASPRHTAYSPTKFAMIGLAESIAYELEPHGIGVTIVNPGTVDTEFFSSESFHDFPDGPRAMMIPASDVARVTVRAIERNRSEVFVPGRLRFAHLVKALMPAVFRAGARRYARTQGMIPPMAPVPAVTTPRKLEK
jgi:short-subunit dehydrogenase